MKKARSFLAVAAAGLALLSGGWAHVYAATPVPGQGNGLKIAPVRTDLTIEKGGSRQVQLYLENITASTMRVSGVVNDFIANSDESGDPKLILDSSKSAPGNSFKSLISSLPTVTLQPNERREIDVTLSVPKTAESGGYYGAIRFAPNNGDSNKNVSLTASVGTIFLITVPGNITEQLKVASFDVSHSGSIGSLFSSGPVSVITRFQNFGNIHVAPFGKVDVKDMHGNVIQEFEINNTDPRGEVLPESIRKFTNDKDDKGQPLLANAKIGRYTIEGSFGYGDNGDLILAKKTIYIIPFKLIATIVFLLAFLIFVLPRLIRIYNRSIVRRAQNASGKQSKPKPRSKPKK